MLHALMIAPVGPSISRCMGELAAQGLSGRILLRLVAVRRFAPSFERTDAAHVVRSSSPPLAPSLRPWMEPRCPKERMLVQKPSARS
jgi:hypothetical protein